MTELDNFLRAVDKLRVEIEAALKADPDAAKHIEYISGAMGFLHGLSTTKGTNGDQKLEVLSMAAIRLFNDMAASMSLVLGGLYQQAVLPVRDIYEVGQLIRLFHEDEAHILKWAGLNDGDRWNQYSPGKVFKALKKSDDADGVENARRGKFYAMLSKAGGHFNLASMAIIRKDGQFNVGPFMGVEIGRRTLYEVAKWGNLATAYLMPFFSGLPTDLVALENYHKMGREWAARYS